MTREEAIEILKNTIVRFGRTNGKTAYSEALQMAVKALEEQRWIPCSKTIDIPDHEVLCCDRHGEELIGWLSYIDDQWLCESDGEMMYNPVAWREKPEPYGGEQDERFEGDIY